MKQSNDYPKHYCGVFGIKNVQNAAEHVYTGLYALQHRGQESAGITTTDGEGFFEHKGMGLVAQVFTNGILGTLKGFTGIGHNRYSTTGNSEIRNAQPLSVDCKYGRISLAHNGNLTNIKLLKAELEERGFIFQTTTDSEVILFLLAQSSKSLEEAIVDMMHTAEGSYSLVIMTKDKLIAVRDPHGFRPLSIGTIDGNPVIASETCAFDRIEAKFVRDVEPGEIVIFEDNKTRKSIMLEAEPQKRVCPSFCTFEYVYFASPDSIFKGRTVYEVREEMGRELARKYPIDADIVIPIPDSGVCAALGYAEESKIPYKMAFIRNHYVGRSFTQPSKATRDFNALMKINLIGSLVKGKRVIVIDDSIVRGTTSKARVKTIRDAGAEEVHMLISCPPHMHPCYYGIDFPNASGLIANNHSKEEICSILGLDSLGYMPEESLDRILGPGHCKACWNGDYPVKPKDILH